MIVFNKCRKLNKTQFITIYLIIFTFSCYAQHPHSFRKIDSLNWATKLESLNKQFGINKTINTKLQLTSLLALSYYPELINQKIIFKEANIKTTLNARPTFFSILRLKRSKRKYIIRINCSKKADEISVYNIDFNSKIGLLGHEFAHITDYQHSGFFGILKRALSCLSAKSKKKFENRIDNLTIQNGLGWQLYDWSYYVLYQSNATEEYKEFKRKIYMTPEQILITMKENGFALK